MSATGAVGGDGAAGLAGRDRIVATYRVRLPPGGRIAELARAICLEQTVEVVESLAQDPWIQAEILGEVQEITPLGGAEYRVLIAYPPAIVAGSLPQLLGVLYGNISLQRGILLEQLLLPPTVVAQFPGPRHGVPGLRALLEVPDRPLVASALKPLGRSPAELAAICEQLARGGVDLIKDDHGLADHPFCPFRERVEACVAAIDRAARVTGRRARYLPSLSERFDTLLERARWAQRAGVGGLLLAPLVTGIDALRALAADPQLDLPLMAHPGLTGSFFAPPVEGDGPPGQGIAADVLLGTLFRLAGADLVIFPSPGGRFPFTPATCARIAAALAAPLGELPAAYPVPAGGVTSARLPELAAAYGRDVVFLIGSDLLAHTADLAARAQEICRQVGSLWPPEKTR
ncbi:MAG: RuBisCO large subunit C-terminal-like domain-containing protein [Myxococcota bacterium]|nr:RuBisCO large subunit C-terminal-like domain-containing protein [Myxococcota bacterium]